MGKCFTYKTLHLAFFFKSIYTSYQITGCVRTQMKKDSMKSLEIFATLWLSYTRADGAWKGDRWTS